MKRIFKWLELGIDIDLPLLRSAIEKMIAPASRCYRAGWNSKIIAGVIKENLEKLGVDLESAKIVATGYDESQ